MAKNAFNMPKNERNAGRKLKQEQPLSRQIPCRTTEQTAKQLAELAAKNGVKISEMVRMILERYILDNKVPTMPLAKKWLLNNGWRLREGFYEKNGWYIDFYKDGAILAQDEGNQNYHLYLNSDSHFDEFKRRITEKVEQG